MFILTNENEVVVWVSEIAEVLVDGIKVDDSRVIIGNFNVFEVEENQLPSKSVVSKYCYNTTKGFFINQAYKKAITIKDVQTNLIKISLKSDPIIDEDLCTLQEFKQYQKKKNGIKCTSEIEFGIDVTLSNGDVEHFSLTSYDQSNLETLYTTLITKKPSVIPYHADGKECRLYSSYDFLQIYVAFQVHKLFHTTYCNALNQMVLLAESKEEVKPINYGIDLTGKHLDNFNVIMTASIVKALNISQEITNSMIQRKFQEIKSLL